MKLELISSRRCPFVQRSIILLAHKGVGHRVSWVDPYRPPVWFSRLSPLGKVPVLRIDDRIALFESAVINEFIDEVTPGRLHPSDPLLKAQNRSWIQFGNGCLSDTYALLTVGSARQFEAVVLRLRVSLERLDAAFGKGPFFNGSEFALIDAAWAPLFIRLRLLGILIGLRLLDECGRLAMWSRTLLALPAVQQADRPELPALLEALARSADGHAARLLDAGSA